MAFHLCFWFISNENYAMRCGLRWSVDLVGKVVGTTTTHNTRPFCTKDTCLNICANQHAQKNDDL